MRKLFLFIFLFSCFSCNESESPEKDSLEPEFGEVQDFEGNKYLTVIIGSQTWMAENLRSSIFNNGDPIPQLRLDSEWGRPTNSPPVIKPAWSFFQNNSSNNVFHGKLYNWYAISDSRNCCPTGWRIPSKSDFDKLFIFLGGEGEALKKIKKEGTIWPQVDLASNSSGFSAFPSGYRNNGGSFFDLGLSTHYWVTDSYPNSTTSYYGLAIFSGQENVTWNGYSKEFGLSVRCIKN